MIRRKTNKFESRRLTLEERINRLERILYNEKSLHRTDELLKGVVGKVNATEKDRDEVIALLKDKLNLGDDERSIYINKSEPFKFDINFFSKDDIKDAASDIEPNLSPKASVPLYFIEIEDTEKNKIIVNLKRSIAAYGYKEIGLEPRRLGYAERDNGIDQLTGLKLISKEKFVNTVLSMLKDNGINIANIISVKDGDTTIEKALRRAKNKWFDAIIERLEETQGLKNIEWYNDKNEIIGRFYVDDAWRQGGSYKVGYDIENDGYTYLYNAGTGKTEYKMYGHEYNADAIAKTLKKIVDASGIPLEKMHAGRK